MAKFSKGSRVVCNQSGVAGTIEKIDSDKAWVELDTGHHGWYWFADLSEEIRRCGTCCGVLSDEGGHTCPLPVGQLARHDAAMARRRVSQSPANAWVCCGCGDRFASGPKRADHQRNGYGCATLMRA
jgi:hypothetical protein